MQKVKKFCISCSRVGKTKSSESTFSSCRLFIMFHTLYFLCQFKQMLDLKNLKCCHIFHLLDWGGCWEVEGCAEEKVEAESGS